MENKKLTTTEDLPMKLTILNKDGKYDTIIYNCKDGLYHDYQSSVATPKALLYQHLNKHPELHDIAEDVRRGVYDEMEGKEFEITDRQWINYRLSQIESVQLSYNKEAEKCIQLLIDNQNVLLKRIEEIEIKLKQQTE